MPLTNAFRGKHYAARRVPRFKSVKLATPGFPIVNGVGSFECIEVGLTEQRELTFEPVTNNDGTDRPHVEGYGIKSKIPLMQTSVDVFRNVYLLGRTTAQAVFKSGADYINFVENTGTPLVPEGSSLLGVLPTVMFDSKKRIITLDLDGYISRYEYEWIFDADNLAAEAEGGTGGTSSGLTEGEYDRTKQLPGNVFKIIADGDEIGYFNDDFKMELKGGCSAPISPGISALDFFDVSIEANMQQTGSEDVLAAIEAAQTDIVVECQFRGGDTYIFRSPGITPTGVIDEKQPMMKLKIGGKYYANADEASPTNIVFNAGTKTVDFKAQWA